ncbi:hypothetical protein A5886_000581 [Enterococcus sp. 8G7_MSG3316]|uniref:bis(5'-nucleosyl)-tetraphosphatase (symmetrical) n=1 Tax=Candidatus Enterococcus testudinis TaxID=1834191 RepID=A0A242A450_9ENTE|nr:bis(5'-nucleosyl)-tetraphosphatase (symmetrical) YqeK [Enterococcus sp. 8G7_MSG3316]OTN75511.1 hypothetical protein A5886_000581 [Enterococcus sp. 8G7_MSG3316]
MTVNFDLYVQPVGDDELQLQMIHYLQQFGEDDTAQHNIDVAEAAKTLALRFHVDAQKAYTAGLLHDISVVIPNHQRIAFQQAMNEPVLGAEEQAPFLLHQQQSAILAKKVFHVTDPEILSAIACHTTLKADFSPLDIVVFLADKIKWDREDQAPFFPELLDALSVSLEASAKVYLDWLFKGDIIVPHPWAVAASSQLDNMFTK